MVTFQVGGDQDFLPLYNRMKNIVNRTRGAIGAGKRRRAGDEQEESVFTRAKKRANTDAGLF
jgi:hypothetical protein